MRHIRRLQKSFFKRLGAWLLKADLTSEAMRTSHLSEFQFSISHTRFISSWGFMYACDYFASYPHNENSYRIFFKKLESELAFSHAQIRVIYLKPEYLHDFVMQILPAIKSKFSIVCGDSDYAIGDQYRDTLILLTNHPLFVRMYAQNLKLHHTKIECLPIGLDYHTFWLNPNLWGANILMPIHQEANLLAILRKSPNLIERRDLIYCNWHFQLHRGDRKQCYENLPSALCKYEKVPITRVQTWGEQANYTFVASPEGNGVDCHRTWEAILLGCIPIIKRNSISSLYEKLPAIIVDEWSSISNDFLEEQKLIMLKNKYDFSSLFISSWKGRFKEQEFHSLTSMTMQEFRSYLSA
jgi:hypothetical protein